jgi:glutamate synthase domain-containing protein 3
MLRPRADLDGRAASLNLAALLAQADPDHTNDWSCSQERNDRPADDALDETIQDDLGIADGASSRKHEKCYAVRNIHRAVGARVSGEAAAAALRGEPGYPAARLEFRGTAGQSFGAFNIDGFELVLVGEANDYVGKGMSGGVLVCRPPERAAYVWEDNVILGNTVLYGATGGRLFAAGRAGERFAVRNSGAVAVVEGVGDHGCEYMTAGTAVVLGPTGRNFGAGMTGGIAYVYDSEGSLASRCNLEFVEVVEMEDGEELEHLRAWIQEHSERTSSRIAARILEAWPGEKVRLRCVRPRGSGRPAGATVSSAAAAVR